MKEWQKQWVRVADGTAIYAHKVNENYVVRFYDKSNNFLMEKKYIEEDRNNLFFTLGQNWDAIVGEIKNRKKVGLIKNGNK